MNFLLAAMLLLGLTIPCASYGQTLEEYFRIAAENNPGLQARYKAYEAALAKAPQMRGLPDPIFSFGYFVSPAETRVGPQRMKFGLTQMFPWFGTLKAQGDAAAFQAEAAFQLFLDARNNLYYQVAAAYYPLYELAAWQRIETDNIAVLASHKQIATRKFANGKAAMVDVIRVDVMLAEAETNLEILQDKEKPLWAALNRLLKRPLATPVTVAGMPEPVTSLPTEIGASAMQDHPAVQALELRQQSAEAARRTAVRQGLPKFGVGVDYVLVDERSDMDLDDNGKDIVMPMLSVSIPIYRGKYRAARQEAAHMQESYRLQKQDTAEALASEYEMARFEIVQKQQQLALYNRQIQATEQALKLLLTAYGNSGKEFEEVLRMQMQVLKYRKAQATAQAALHVALAKRKYILGKVQGHEYE